MIEIPELGTGEGGCREGTEKLDRGSVRWSTSTTLGIGCPQFGNWHIIANWRFVHPRARFRHCQPPTAFINPAQPSFVLMIQLDKQLHIGSAASHIDYCSKGLTVG